MDYHRLQTKLVIAVLVVLSVKVIVGVPVRL
jgi:hypothetical protein